MKIVYRNLDCLEIRISWYKTLPLAQIRLNNVVMKFDSINLRPNNEVLKKEALILCKVNILS